MSHLLDLAQNISEKLNELENGSLDKQGLNDVIAATGQLQEALYILRFKGYEEEVEVKEKSREAIKLDFGSVSSNQISLIDAIEEAQIYVGKETTSFSSHSEPKIVWESNDEVEEVVEVVEKQKENSTKVVEEVKVSIETKTVKEANNVSLNDQLIQDGSKPRLGEKLQQSAIKDLRAAISINQRFLFINGLFDGKTEVFQEALETLESAHNAKDAKAIEQRLIQKYGWDIEDKTVLQFSNLIDRRFN